MQADTLSPGMQLAGRYRVEDLVGETTRSQTWRAHDRVLKRSVSVQVVGADDDCSAAFLTAARAATGVDDPRFLRVLDAATEDGLAYVVREWARGISLDIVLQQGPLPAPRAAELVREVAESLAAAHEAGVQHGRLDPARVIVKHNGAVRVLGLATDRALHAPVHARAAVPARGAAVRPDQQLAEQTDVTALGRLLYACLVARWPGGRDLGLPAAPTEHGRLLRPRQVRAGVDPSVDAVVDRILGTPPRHHATPLRTAADVGRELAVLTLAEEALPAFVGDEAAGPRGMLPEPPDASDPPPAVHVLPPPRTAARPPPRPEPHTRTGARGPAWIGIALLIVMAAVLAFLVGRVGSNVLSPVTGGDEPSSTTNSGPTKSAPETGPVKITAIGAFDPEGTDGDENGDAAPLADDQDTATAWTTQTYFNHSELGLLKSGVGLLVDLGSEQDVSRVDLTMVNGPTALTVYAAPGATAAPTSVQGLEELGDTVAGADGADGDVPASVEARDPVTTRWLVVWLTDLPAVGTDEYMGAVAEIAVTG